MAKIKRRGESGAAKNYITRNQAIKKLQISLSDFRRLCILKGIYPREPLNKKRANKGSSAPASFYYHKDIQYLLHEPLLIRFREHKTFAKKLARALGRGEWALAKNLEDAKPLATLDHLVKERYPTFTLALQDLQDPLNLVHLFSTLPTNPIPGKTLVAPEIISECSRLITELKLYTIKTHSLKKVFLGIKGIYYEMVAPGQGGDMIPVRWLEGYEFQQNIPHDVDFRILLTFVDLYRTLIKFVLFKLYTEENLVYPPPINTELEEQGENVGAMQLVEKQEEASVAPVAQGSEKKISKKEVKKVIKGIKATGDDVEMDVDGENSAHVEEEAEEEFVERPSKVTDENEDIAKAPLTTYSSLLSSSATASSSSLPIFSSYTFYLSREIPTKTWEFIIKATGGRVITALQLPTLDSSSPSAEEQKLVNSITHVVIDRPIPQEKISSAMRDRKWVWVQPQWVADCINRNKIISSEEYKPGNLLPPHLSPWEGEGELSRPWLEENGQAVSGEGAEQVDDVELEEEDDEEDEEEDGDEEEETGDLPSALLAASENPSDPTLVHAAELEAERNGISHAEFQKQLKELSKKNAPAKPATKAKEGEEDLAKIMMSNKKAKLYEKMKYGNKQKQDELAKLETKRKAIEKRKKKEARA